MQDIKVKVGIVILTYNSEKVIKECLESAQNIDYQNLEIVVVDNCSHDHTCAIVKNEFPNITLIINEQNWGYAEGNNVGIRYLIQHKNVDYIIVLNDDTVVTNKLVSKLLEPFYENEKIGVTGPIITYEQERNRIWFAGGYLNKVFFYTKHPHMNELLNNQQLVTQCDFITGCCMCISKEVINKVGMLNKDYFMYFEDVEFCLRAKQHGFEIALVKENLVYHKVSASAGIKGTNKLTKLRAYYIARNPLMCIKEHVHGTIMLFNVIGQLVIRLPYYVHKCIKEKTYDSIPQYLLGIVDGIKFESIKEKQ